MRHEPLPHATRIAIPHHTTASAITMHAAVRAFSKADEAIIVLSFAYPDEMLCDSVGAEQGCESRCTQPAHVDLLSSRSSSVPVKRQLANLHSLA